MREMPEGEDSKLTPPDRDLQRRAIDLARAGSLAEAKRILGHLAAAYAGAEHELLVAQYNAVNAKIDEIRAEAKASLEAAPLQALEAPPATYTLVRSAAVQEPLPKLMKRSERKNGITDDQQWFSKNDVHLPTYFVPPSRDMLFAPGVVETVSVVDLLSGFSYTEHTPSPSFDPTPLPLQIPLAYGTAALTRAIGSAPYTIAVYGDRIVAVFDRPSHVARLFDLGTFVHPPANRVGSAVVGKATLTTPDRSGTGKLTVETNSITNDLRFALARDGVLYVQHSNNGYAKESKGETAYVSAIDLESASLLWQSAPLVANGQSFVIVGGAVVSGYGFTAEPDFVYVLDRATGMTKQKLPVSTSPEVIVRKDSALLVRGYDTDFVFDIR